MQLCNIYKHCISLLTEAIMHLCLLLIYANLRGSSISNSIIIRHITSHLSVKFKTFFPRYIWPRSPSGGCLHLMFLGIFRYPRQEQMEYWVCGPRYNSWGKKIEDSWDIFVFVWERLHLCFLKSINITRYKCSPLTHNIHLLPRLSSGSLVLRFCLFRF